MKKDLEWAKKQMKEIIDGRMTENEMFDRGYKNGITNSLDILNHLDDPETIEETIHLLESVLKENKRLGELLEEKHEEWLELMGIINNRETLSQGWIDKNVVHVRGLGDIIKAEAFENLLVPKQELPVIPKFVAEHIENRRGESLAQAYNIPTLTKVGKWLLDKKNCETFARAFLDGYEVEEEEQKYVVKIPTNENNDIPYAIVADSGDIWTDALPSKYKLTEEEIRGLTKGDVLFEHFAVKVEELEE